VFPQPKQNHKVALMDDMQEQTFIKHFPKRYWTPNRQRTDNVSRLNTNIQETWKFSDGVITRGMTLPGDLSTFRQRSQYAILFNGAADLTPGLA
jgi:hypothetical protein